jgi:hypothetical protein
MNFMTRARRSSVGALSVFCVLACDVAPDPARVEQLARTNAQDTVARAWKRATKVDSILTRADTSIVWISPAVWMATDAPQASVKVRRDGRVVAVQWIAGG